MTAGHYALREGVPTKSSHSKMLWQEWGVPLPGSTGSCINVRSPFPTPISSGVPTRYYAAWPTTGSQ
jgi:hypothetical protein